MLKKLRNLFLDRGLVGGITSDVGWGAFVRNQILPLLIHPKLKHHESILREGFARAGDPISVFVVGEGNFGKSTLVNSLLGLGVEIAKSDFLPLTWHITRYTPAEAESRFEIHYEPTDGSASRLESTVEATCSIAEIERGVIRFSSLKDLETVVTEEENARRQSGAASAIWQVVQSVKKSETGIHALELVDSPGISQVRVGTATGESIEDFYHRADVVLWLFAADKTNSRETRHSLESMSRYGKPIIGVVNRADLIPAGQRSQVLNDVKHQFSGLLQEVVLLSARDAFTATANGNNEKLQQSGLPELRNAIFQLAEHSGQRTKALSLYNTSKQAAVEAATILNEEADVLADNFELYGKNLDSAASFEKRGKKHAKQVLRSESGNAASAIAKTMRRTFVAFGDDDDPLFDEQALNETIRQQKALLIGKVNNALDSELKNVQDEIAVREYRVQSYRGDATVKSHEARTSINMSLTHVPHELQQYSLDYEPDWGGRIVEFLGNLAGAFWQMFGHEPTHEEIRAKQKQRRTRLLEEFIAGTTSVEDQVHKHIRDSAANSTRQVASMLDQEVQECFNREFNSSAKVRQKIEEHRKQAEMAVVPPAITYSTYAMLCKVKNISAWDLRAEMSKRKPKRKKKSNTLPQGGNCRGATEITGDDLKLKYGITVNTHHQTRLVSQIQQPGSELAGQIATIASHEESDPVQNQVYTTSYSAGTGESGLSEVFELPPIQNEKSHQKENISEEYDAVDEILSLDDLQRKYGYSKGTRVYNLINGK